MKNRVYLIELQANGIVQWSLVNHLSLRAGKKATMITTNLAFNRWGEIVKDKVLGVVIK